jgi:carbon monoxide dehydrogenase subunit G
MELNNDFRVSVGPPEAWKVLSDVERIAPLLPGAQLQEVEGDDYRGIVKVKVGPITAQYKGTATFVEQDETAGKMVLKATGRDTKGQGNANAMITVTMSPDGDGTKVNVATDLTITGKVAQFGRGVLADVSGKLVTQFVDALEKDLESGEAAPAAGAEEAAEEAAAPLRSRRRRWTPPTQMPHRPLLHRPTPRPSRRAHGASTRRSPSRSTCSTLREGRWPSVCFPSSGWRPRWRSPSSSDAAGHVAPGWIDSCTRCRTVRISRRWVTCEPGCLSSLTCLRWASFGASCLSSRI